MRTYSFKVIPVLLLTAILNISADTKEKAPPGANTFFPVNNGITLVYKSSFGESVTKYTREGEYTISSSEAENFKYRQSMIVNENGVYVKETSQFLRVLLFIKKEAVFTYGKPLLRFPLPLKPGMQWNCEEDEYSDGEMHKVTVAGKAFDRENIVTKAGNFNAIKLETIIEGSGKAKNRVTEWYVEGLGLIKANISIEGGGLMGFLRDLLGYGIIVFELKEIRRE